MLSFPLSPQVAGPNGLTLFLSRACWDTVNALILTTLPTHAAYTDFPDIISLFLAVSFLIAIKLSAAPPVRNPSSSDSYNGQTEALDDGMPSTSLPTTEPATTAPPTLRAAQTDEEETEGRRKKNTSTPPLALSANAAPTGDPAPARKEVACVPNSDKTDGRGEKTASTPSHPDDDAAGTPPESSLTSSPPPFIFVFLFLFPFSLLVFLLVFFSFLCF